jgi:hypothetical protein
MYPSCKSPCNPIAAALALSLCAALSLAGCDNINGPTPRPGLSVPDGRSLNILDSGGGSTDGVALPPPHQDGSPPPPPPKLDGGTPPPPPKKDSGTPPPPPPPKDSGPPPLPGDYDYKKHIKWHTISSTGKSCSVASYSAFGCDVMSHTKSPYYGSDIMTQVHETQHFMAHENDGSTPAADKFIYYKNGQGAFFPEPNIKTQDIVASIKFKGTTYNTYIASRPTQKLGENIVDEWRAYLTEEIAAIQLAQAKGQTSGISGLVLGGVEYLYYNACMLHALQTKEPSYFQNNPQGKAVFAMLAEETKLWTIDQGVKKNLFFSLTNQKAQSTLNDIATGATQSHLRTTLRSLYGSTWTNRVLGFK